jgi:hypothetical protein
MAEASDAWLLVVDGAIRGNLGEARGGWHLNGSLVRTEPLSGPRRRTTSSKYDG